MARFLVVAGGMKLARAGGKSGTALHCACQTGHVEVAHLLVAAGGVELARAVDERNATALHLACDNGHLEIARLLIAAGGVKLVKELDERGAVALHYACLKGHLEVARLLVEEGGVELVRAVDKRNATALHLACQNGHLDVAQFILSEGGFPAMYVRADGQYTPIDLASKFEHTDVVRLLLGERQRGQLEAPNSLFGDNNTSSEGLTGLYDEAAPLDDPLDIHDARKLRGEELRKEVGNLFGDNEMPLADRAVEWTCSICTLHNAPSFLVCGACGNERDVNRRSDTNEGGDEYGSTGEATDADASDMDTEDALSAWLAPLGLSRICADLLELSAATNHWSLAELNAEDMNGLGLSTDERTVLEQAVCQLNEDEEVYEGKQIDSGEEDEDDDIDDSWRYK